MGLKTSALKWVESYLQNRQQSVKFGKILSDMMMVKSGVPQGSILGPLLFITCTNDIVEALADFDIFTYADDMQVLTHGTNKNDLQNKLEIAIERANIYYTKNSLCCNPAKSEVMIMGTEKRLKKIKNFEVQVTEGNKKKILKGQKSLKILGVHVDQALNWSKHTSTIKQRATFKIRNLHRINSCIPLKYRRILYNSFVAPHFSYADIIWNSCGASNKNKLQRCQNFAARSMIGTSKYSSATQAIKKLQLLPLEQKREINIAVHVKKSLNERTPITIQNLYKNQASLMNNRSTENATLNYPKHNLHQYQQSPFYSSIKIWNSLTTDQRLFDMKNYKKELQRSITEQHLFI